MLYHGDGMRSSDLFKVVLLLFDADMTTVEGKGD